MGDISFKTINITSVCSTKIARNNFLNFKRSQYVLKLRINSLQKKNYMVLHVHYLVACKEGLKNVKLLAEIP